MKTLLMTLLCLSFCVAARAQELKKIVIETSVGVNTPMEVGEMFRLALASGLTRSGLYDPLTNRAEYMSKMEGELKAQQSGMIADDQMFELGRAAGAQYVLYANIVEFDGQYMIAIQMTELGSGRSTKTPPPIVTQRSQLMQEAQTLAMRISQGGLDEADSIVTKGDTALPPSMGLDCTHICGKDRAEAMWSDAQAACQKKGEGWRLPTVEELEVIFGCRHSIAGQGKFRATIFWSSSARNGFSVYALDFTDGTRAVVSKTTPSAFRCVR